MNEIVELLKSLFLFAGIISLVSISILCMGYHKYLMFELEQRKLELGYGFKRPDTSLGLELQEEEEFIPEHEDTEFDKRIERLREELLNDNFYFDGKSLDKLGSDGEILEPGIYNIPHQEVDVYKGGDELEISE